MEFNIFDCGDAYMRFDTIWRQAITWTTADLLSIVL